MFQASLLMVLQKAVNKSTQNNQVFIADLVYNLWNLITIFTVHLANEDVNKTSTPKCDAIL